MDEIVKLTLHDYDRLRASGSVAELEAELVRCLVTNGSIGGAGIVRCFDDGRLEPRAARGLLREELLERKDLVWQEIDAAGERLRVLADAPFELDRCRLASVIADVDKNASSRRALASAEAAFRGGAAPLVANDDAPRTETSQSHRVPLGFTPKAPRRDTRNYQTDSLIPGNGASLADRPELVRRSYVSAMLGSSKRTENEDG